VQVYDPTMHDVKQAIQKVEWAISHLDDYLSSDVMTDDPDFVEDCRDRLHITLVELRSLV
jgi:hypothetical protein